MSQSNMKTPKTRSDIAVQCTNDSSILSKASMVNLGYFTDPYVSYFVSKTRRRSPIINRGYYVRAKAVDAVVQQFLQSFSAQPKQILSLGAGFDSLYFRLQSAGCLHNTLYVEVDFPDLVARKTKIIEHYDCLSELVNKEDRQPEGNIAVSGAGYKLVGVDLTDLTSLQAALTHCGVQPAVPTLILSEVVLTYIKPDKCSAVISWVANTFSTSVFVIYEQVYPRDAFGIIMMKHFEKIGSPLKCIHLYPDLQSQRQRFLSLGWDYCDAINMNEFYQSLNCDEALRIASVEPFDEYEEWHLKCAHYVLVCAFRGQQMTSLMTWLKGIHNDKAADCVAVSGLATKGESSKIYNEKTDACRSTNVCTKDTSVLSNVSCEDNKCDIVKEPSNDDTCKFVVPSTGCDLVSPAFGGFQTLAGTYPLCSRFAHTLSRLGNRCMIIGGFGDNNGKHSRMNDVISYDFDENKFEVIDHNAEGVGARMYHTTTIVNGSDLLIIGGRTSPAKPGCPVILLSKTEDTDSQGGVMLSCGWRCSSLLMSGAAPSPRWRHCAVLWKQGSEEEVYVFGGKTDTEAALSDCFSLSTASWRWREMNSSGNVPCARHSMTADMWRHHLVIAGGINAWEKPLSSIHVMDTDTETWTLLDTSPICPRYGHTSAVVGNVLILVGGVNFLSPPPGIDVIDLETKTVVHVTTQLQDPEKPLMFHGHASTILEERKRMVIVGGGGNCFSFGTHLNSSPMYLDLPELCDLLYKNNLNAK